MTVVVFDSLCSFRLSVKKTGTAVHTNVVGSAASVPRNLEQIAFVEGHLM